MKKQLHFLEKYAISNRAIQGAVDKRLGSIISNSLQSNKISPLANRTQSQLTRMSLPGENALLSKTVKNIKARKSQLAKQDDKYFKLLHEARKNIFVN